MPWRRYRNPYEPIEVLSADQIESIHDPRSRCSRRSGWISSTRIPRHPQGGRRGGRARHAARALPARPGPGERRQGSVEFTLHARNPEHNLTVGGNHLNFGSVASAPNVSDLDKGRRPGSFEDYCNLVRLCQSLNIVQFLSGYPVEPADLPPATRHLDSHYAAITLTDKIWHPIRLGKQRISDAIDMICIARGSTARS